MPRVNKKLMWTPHKFALSRRGKSDSIEVKRYLRNTSSAYVSKPYVRRYVLKKYKNTCNWCGCNENLQIDHIVPVNKATKKNIHLINRVQNLQALCYLCNNRKTSYDIKYYFSHDGIAIIA